MDNIYPKCALCGSTPAFGLYDGFRLGKKFVCSGCEEKIVAADINQHQYTIHIQNMKKLLYS